MGFTGPPCLLRARQTRAARDIFNVTPGNCGFRGLLRQKIAIPWDRRELSRCPIFGCAPHKGRGLSGGARHRSPSHRYKNSLQQHYFLFTWRKFFQIFFQIFFRIRVLQEIEFFFAYSSVAREPEIGRITNKMGEPLIHVAKITRKHL